MDGLLDAASEARQYNGYREQACPLCSKNAFRHVNDVLRTSFRVYRDLDGTLRWLKFDPAATMVPTYEPLVCIACENQRPDVATTAYDHVHGKHIGIEFDRVTNRYAVVPTGA